MRLSPDDAVLWRWGFVVINQTLLTTWGLMLVLSLGSWLVTRRLGTGLTLSRWQCVLDTLVGGIQTQIGEMGLERPGRFVGFLGTLFLFTATANLFTVLPGYEPPTASLSTTAALACLVFLAVPYYGIRDSGLGPYLKAYFKPSFILFPFHVLGELTRTLTLAVRMFGNMMSGEMIVAILLLVTPLLFPVVMRVLGLLTGMVQAFIFATLATVYIAAAARARQE